MKNVIVLLEVYKKYRKQKSKSCENKKYAMCGIKKLKFITGKEAIRLLRSSGIEAFLNKVSLLHPLLFKKS